MFKYLAPLALTVHFANPALADSHTPEDYPKRDATMAEIVNNCAPNPLTSILLSFNPEEDKPFELLNCQFGHVGLYDCTTLGRLIEFEWDIKSLFQDSGRPIIEGSATDEIASSYTPLITQYDKFCLQGLS